VAKKRSVGKTPAQVSKEEEREFQARSDLRTLQDAETIREDRIRLLAASRMADEQLDALKKAKKGMRTRKKKQA